MAVEIERNSLCVRDSLARINEERNKANLKIQNYNISIRRFPSNLLAGMFGFEKMNKFEAEAGAEKAPQVKF